jgi:hypothetical protein
MQQQGCELFGEQLEVVNGVALGSERLQAAPLTLLLLSLRQRAALWAEVY